MSSSAWVVFSFSWLSLAISICSSLFPLCSSLFKRYYLWLHWLVGVYLCLTVWQSVFLFLLIFFGLLISPPQLLLLLEDDCFVDHVFFVLLPPRGPSARHTLGSSSLILTAGADLLLWAVLIRLFPWQISGAVWIGVVRTRGWRRIWLREDLNGTWVLRLKLVLAYQSCIWR